MKNNYGRRYLLKNKVVILKLIKIENKNMTTLPIYILSLISRIETLHVYLKIVYRTTNNR